MSDLVTDLFDPGNAWSRRTRERLTGLSPDLTGLLLHLATADEFWNWRYKVDAAWKRRAKALLTADGADELVRYAVRELARDGSFHDVRDADEAIRGLLSQGAPTGPRSLALGFLLAAGWLREDTGGLSADLALVARKNAQAMDSYYRVDHDIAGAAFHALGDLPGPGAMDVLWTLHFLVTTSMHPQRVLAKSVKRAAARLGVPPHELAERTVPRHGLETDGTLTVGWIGRGALWWNASVDAVIALDADGRVTVEWTDGDRVTRTTAPFRCPNGYKNPTRADSITLVQRTAKAIEATVAEERRRLGTSAVRDRTLSRPDWVRFYRDHPVTGVVTRALAWEYRLPDDPAHHPLDPAADPTALPAAARIRLRPTSPDAPAVTAGP
ncbi:DUF4132 domain-containing protein [Streptomyces yangpuensis]|uniref:DUF4132 domain-containing protein n=1 Tax=Streptomyces yangpuensis TaxID=1648182 RepID=UPI003814492D